MIGTTGLRPAGAREGGRHHWPNVAGEPSLSALRTDGRFWKSGQGVTGRPATGSAVLTHPVPAILATSAA
jgi:hypothetical protein